MTPDLAINKIQDFIDCDGIEMIDIVTLITAQDALRKQMPKKPTTDKHFFRCAVCGDMVAEKAYMKYYKRTYWPKCGQAIDWSEYDNATRKSD